MTSQILKISGDCRKIKLQNFSILRYYSSICATHTRLRCNKLFETAFTHFLYKPLPIIFKARKSLNFHTPPLFEAPVRGEPFRIWWWSLVSENYQMVKKSWH